MKSDADPSRPARVEDVYALAEAMPHVTRWPGRENKPINQVGA